MRRIFVLLLLMVFCTGASAEVLPPYAYESQGKTVRSYASDTLQFTVEKITYQQVVCFVTKVWMAEPGRQIRKATAAWEESLSLPVDMAQQVEGAWLAVNGSGYVSPVFPEIPDNYPGSSEDYFYTPLGSLTVTDGQVYRHLQGVPFYGLTLQEDGLHMHTGEDIEEILPHAPAQTWSFYEGCPMILDHESILDRNWSFAKASAIRTIIAKMDDHNYLLLTVSNRERYGLSLIQCVELLQEKYDPIWAYDLDGGPSSALMVRQQDGHWETLFGGRSKDADIMAFTD